MGQHLRFSRRQHHRRSAMSKEKLEYRHIAEKPVLDAVFSIVEGVVREESISYGLQCPTCTAVLPDPTRFVHHITYAHSTIKQCSVCDGFPSHEQIQLHLEAYHEYWVPRRCDICDSSPLQDWKKVSTYEHYFSRHRQYPEWATLFKGNKFPDSTTAGVYKKFKEGQMKWLVDNMEQQREQRPVPAEDNHTDDKCVYLLLYRPDTIEDVWSFWRSVFYVGEGDYTRPYCHVWGATLYKDEEGYHAYDQEKLIRYCFDKRIRIGIFRIFERLSKKKAGEIEGVIFQCLQEIVFHKRPEQPKTSGMQEWLWLRQQCYRLFSAWRKELVEIFGSVADFTRRIEEI